MGARTLLVMLQLALCFWVKGMGPYRSMEASIDAPLRATPASTTQEPERLIAAVLNLGLGTFGAHRLYLGTSPKVPIIYGITFGGFGILALIDLGHVLFTKDLDPYRHNEHVFMWAGDRKQLTPP
ncbi:MAG: TM2 domain-containing protein [Flavobacteriales bacterium]|nr:TM2 domain-containing protein [Flavobacteriales bacterium]